MAMVHLISTKVSIEIAFKCIQLIPPSDHDNSLNASENKWGSQIVLSKLYLLTSLDEKGEIDGAIAKVNEIIEDLSEGLDTEPLKACQVPFIDNRDNIMGER